jgi:hypothetical protein
MSEARVGEQHPLADAAARAALAAHVRAGLVAEELARLRRGSGTSVADTLVALSALEDAVRRRNEAHRRLVTLRIARANHAVAGQDLLEAARRLAHRTLDERVRGLPLDS